MKGIGAFVKYLVSYAAEGDDVPGLKAMVPGGAFVKEINKTQPGQPGAGTNWFVVSSNFHVELFDDSHHPPEFPRELVVKLAEGFVDRLFEGANDLVVDISSMGAIDAKVGGFVRDGLDARRERHGLPHELLQPAAGDRGARRLAARSASVQAAARLRRWPSRRPLPRCRSRAAGAPMPEPARGCAGARASWGHEGEHHRARVPNLQLRSRAEAAELTRASLAAEMPAHVVTKQEFAVRVRLSRNAIEATEGRRTRSAPSRSTPSGP